MPENSPHPTVTAAIDHLFRQESGRMVALLSRMYGFDRVELIEDAVQEAFLKAAQRWKAEGVPHNPAGWIVQAAKNHVLDFLRRESNFAEKIPSVIYTLLGDTDYSSGYEMIYLDGEIRDAQLRMMFACCHPAIGEEMQIALVLKTLCGFSVPEIARSFLLEDDTIAKRLVRARAKLRQLGVALEVPVGPEMYPRMEALLKSLYLMFTEGHNASSGAQLIRRAVCDEAIRLTRLLPAQSSTDLPEVHALLALMLFQSSRFDARIGAEGQILLLKEQDRTRWNQDMILEATNELNASASGPVISDYHLEAGIASHHCAAASYAETNWREIVMLYDLYIQRNNSPVIALNRAIALGELNGPAEGIDAILNIPNRKRIESFYLYHAALGDLYKRIGDSTRARSCYEQALSLTTQPAEQELLRKKLSVIF